MAFAAGIGALAGALTARSAGGSIIIGGIDILSNLQSQAITSYSYTDNTSDQADNLSVEIADPNRTWMTSFLPKKGVECIAQIKVLNWTLPGDSRLIDCGVFWFDQVDFAGPPNVVSIKATSIPTTTGLKSQKKSRSWEGVTLKKIMEQIATENLLALIWDTKEDPNQPRVDQNDTPDLEFARDKCKDNSLSLKIFNRQLIIYSEKDYESKPPLYVIPYGLSHILSYSFSSKLNDTYADAHGSYVSPKTGKLIENVWGPGFGPEGSKATLFIQEQPDEDDNGESDGADGGDGGLRAGSPAIDTQNASATTSASMERKVKSKLREKNKKEYSCQLTLVGNPDYLSGFNVQMIGWGIFDGKWFISSTSHSISSSGYVTELTLRKALEGY